MHMNIVYHRLFIKSIRQKLLYKLPEERLQNRFYYVNAITSSSELTFLDPSYWIHFLVCRNLFTQNFNQFPCVYGLKEISLRSTEIN